MGLLLAIILLITALALYKYLTRNFDYWEKKGVEYVKPTILIGNLGSLLRFEKSIFNFLGDLYKNCQSDVLGIWIFNTPQLIIKSPEVIKSVLVKDFHHFAFRGVCNDEKADPLFSRMLFASEPTYWKAMRTQLTPIFSSGKLKNMIPLINTVGINMEQYLRSKCKIRSGQIRVSLEAKELCAKFTTDVITSCAFGMDAKSFVNEDAEFRNVGRKMFNFTTRNSLRGVCYFFAPSLPKLFKFTFFDPDVNKFCREAFWYAVNEREQSGLVRNDVVDTLIYMKNTLSCDEFKFEGDTVVAQAMQFFAAGFETTSSTITFALYELAVNEGLQTKLRQEIHKAINMNSTINYEDLNNLPLLDKVIKETLRKYPALPFLNRQCLEDYKIPNTDIIIDKGTLIQIPMFGLHYDPEYYPNPNVFDPERFSEENIRNIPQCAYIPFGDGPHNCIGARMGLIMAKLGLIYVLRQFQIVPNDNTPMSVVFDPKSFVLAVKGGISIDLVLDRSVHYEKNN